MTGLFDGVLDRGPVGPLTDDAEWLRALLDAESALAEALAEVGLITVEQAGAIVTACYASPYDPAALGAAAADGGNPVIPLVKELTARVREEDPEAARHVHRGATSQDIMDTAAMLVVRRAGRVLQAELLMLGVDLRDLAHRHRTTPMPGRTLLQQALPTTFGAVVAGWVMGLSDATRRINDILTHRTAAQLGGAVGTLASLGPYGPDVATAYADRLNLPEPLLPWHTERGRVAEIAAALGQVCGAVGTVAQDVVLLAQTEVGEVTEEGGAGVGGSSTMPHKRNPVAAVSALANARQAPGLVANLLAAQIQEHQRAAGSWHAEWLPLSDLLRRAGSAVSWLRAGVERMRVHPDRMRANLDLTGGLALSERLTTDLIPELGRMEAHRRVTEACREAVARDRDLVDTVTERLEGLRTPEQVRALLDPAAYLGAAAVFTDRVTGRTGPDGTGRPGRTDSEEGKP